MDMNFRSTEKFLPYPLKCKQIIEEVEKVFLGNREAVRKVLMTLLAGGHVLLEDIPGVGKTTLATCLFQGSGSGMQSGFSSRRISCPRM